jgi:tetratricopeptide (TPR) repeat protein
MDIRTRQWIVGDYGVDRNSLGVYYENLADDAVAKVSKGKEPMKIIQDYFKSYQQFAWCVELDPTDTIYAFNLGNALVHLGRNAEALDWYARAVSLNPQYAEAYFNAAVAALNLGQGQKAGEMFRKVLDLQPDHAEAKRGLEYVEKQGLYRP